MGYSIDAIFREDSGAFSQRKIIGLDQSFHKHITNNNRLWVASLPQSIIVRWVFGF